MFKKKTLTTKTFFSLSFEEMKNIITIIQHQFRYLTACRNDMMQTEISKFVTIKSLWKYSELAGFPNGIIDFGSLCLLRNVSTLEIGTWTPTPPMPPGGR